MKRKNDPNSRHWRKIIPKVVFIVSLLVAGGVALKSYGEFNRICSDSNVARIDVLDEDAFEAENLEVITSENSQSLKHLATFQPRISDSYLRVNFSPDSMKLVIQGVPGFIGSNTASHPVIWKPYIESTCYLNLRTRNNFYAFSLNSDVVVFNPSRTDTYPAYSVRNGWLIQDWQFEQEHIVRPVESDNILLDAVISQWELEEHERIDDAALSPDRKLLAVARIERPDIYSRGYVDLWGIPATENDE